MAKMSEIPTLFKSGLARFKSDPQNINIVGLVTEVIGIILLFAFATSFLKTVGGGEVIIDPANTELHLAREAAFEIDAFIGLFLALGGPVLQIWASELSRRR